jgi:hypothetical protein
MNHGRYQSIYQGLSAIARKVYDAIPAQETWSMAQIQAELQRTGGTARDKRILEGCVNSLKEAGIIKEPVRGFFIREHVSPPTSKTVETKPIKETTLGLPNTTPLPSTQPKGKPLDKLAGIANRANMLAASLRDLASDIETAALELEEEVAASLKASEKLQALSSILKNI